MSVTHSKLGAMEYRKVYLGLDKPHLFQCWFENDPYQLYLGMLMDEYDVGEFDSSQSGTTNTTYYFTPVDDGMIVNLEAGRLTLRQVFTEWPVMWAVHQERDGKVATVWKERSSAAPYYLINESATLMN